MQEEALGFWKEKTARFGVEWGRGRALNNWPRGYEQMLESKTKIKQNTGPPLFRKLKKKHTEVTGCKTAP